MNFRNLTAADGSTIYVSDSQIVSVVPAGTGSVITLTVQSEGHPLKVAVQQTPAQVLSAETVS